MPTILVVDDDVGVRKAICSYFEGLKWAQCREAADGLDAISEALESKPDLVLLDFNIPLKAIQTAKILKTIMPAVPLVMLTARVSKTNAPIARDSVVPIVFRKDDLGALTNCVRAMLGAHEWSGAVG